MIRSVLSLGLLLVCTTQCPAPAQPEPQPETPPATQPLNPPGSDDPTPPDQPRAANSIEVAGHLWAVIGRYRFAATADRVRVTLIGADGQSDMHSLVVRCVPGAAGLARVELGDLALVATDDRLVAIHQRDPTTFAEIVPQRSSGNPGQVLRELLPPLPIPQISLAFDAAEVDWCPLVDGLRWQHAERIKLDGRDGVRLRGTSNAGDATLEIVGARVRRFEAELAEGGATKLIVECSPIEPDDPGAWPLDVAGRREVGGLGALRPLASGIEPGGRLPRLALSPGTRRLGQDTEPGLMPENRLYTVLLIRDDTPAETTRLGTLAALHAMTELQRELLRGRIDGRFDERVRLVELLGVVVAQTTGGILDRVAEEEAAWNAAVVSARPVESQRPELTWTGGEARLIDRLAPGAELVLVMHDGTGEILAIKHIDEATTAKLLADDLAAAVPTLDSR